MSDASTFELSTRHLQLRPLRAPDAASLHQIWTAPGVRRFLWDDEVISLDRTSEIVATSNALFLNRRFGLWGASLRGSQALVGFGGLWFFRDPPELELVFGVAENCWGRGYALEIATCIAEYAFTALGMPSVRASTDAQNLASSRVLDKAGFVLFRRDTVGGLDTLFYERLRTSDGAPQ